MTTRNALAWVVALLFLLTPAWSWGQSARKAESLLNGWQMPEAKRVVDALATTYPDEPNVKYLRARLAFFQGDYKRAVALLDEANEAQSNPYWKQLREVVSNTQAVTQKFKRVRSPKGYFDLFVDPGKDEVLVSDALRVLDEAYEQIGRALQHRPPVPIRVEVYPTTATLAKVSSLSEKDIKTSGTIALCKYNRLMITSPRALLQGYGWADTLVHEYVHYVINHKTKAQVPIWMHEGMAKYLERRWRGPNKQSLSPSSEDLLRQYIEKDTLITFEQMHPSMAKLPSQEDAAVAFAEVFTVMEYLEAQLGEGAFAKVLDHINDGLGAKRAFAKALSTTFPAFERKWKAYLKQRPKVILPKGARFGDKLQFKGDANPNDLKQIAAPKARDHVHLGELLQGRKRYKAALVQYNKAARMMGETNPVLQTRLAQSHLALKQYTQAQQALLPILSAYPSDVRVWLGLGEAALGLKDAPKALEYLQEAIYINPFDPRVHELLAQAHKAVGQPAQAEVALSNLKRVR